LKIFVAIHWEALRLWIKGARLAPRPDAAAAKAAANSGLAIDERPDYTGAALTAAATSMAAPRESAPVQ
jgi:hypothetical protein